MTSLIDVIFLLLLFFMLSSTFSRFAEVDLAAGRAGASPIDTAPVFAQLGTTTLRVNGDDVALGALAEHLRALVQPDRQTPVLIALGPGVTAQRLTDVLVGLRAVPDITVTVLEAS